MHVSKPKKGQRVILQSLRLIWFLLNKVYVHRFSKDKHISSGQHLTSWNYLFLLQNTCAIYLFFPQHTQSPYYHQCNYIPHIYPLDTHVCILWVEIWVAIPSASVTRKVSLSCSCTVQRGFTTAVKFEPDGWSNLWPAEQYDLSNNQVTLLDCQQLSVDPTGNPGVGDERRLARSAVGCWTWMWIMERCFSIQTCW